jgi:hypothetical protein
MSKVFIQESTLTAIGNAIRNKTGKSALIAPGNMPTEINSIVAGGGGGSADVEPIVIKDEAAYTCSGALGGTYIKLFGNTITTENIANAQHMFYQSSATEIPFAINFNNSYGSDITNMFGNSKIQRLPVMTNLYPSNIKGVFAGCRIKEIPDGFGNDWDWSYLHSQKYANADAIFQNCTYLRKISPDFLSNMWGVQTNSAAPAYNAFNGCWALDEVIGFPVQQAAWTSNRLNGIVSSCFRLKNFTFATNSDGTPQTTTWKSQVLDFTADTGYSSFVTSLMWADDSEFSNDNLVNNMDTYNAKKNTENWLTGMPEFSRYNHASAVRTINSLPDTSAYGTNTIKFESLAGSATDEGAIGNLTEAEIAVAAAKGWTVTLV